MANSGKPMPTVQLPVIQAMSPPIIKAKPVDCPPGLEYLLNLDSLLIKQKVEVLEVITGYETNNQYDVLNSFNQRVFVASEDTDCCTRNCCGPNRAFDMRIIDHTQREVIHLYRPLRCECCLCFCCLQYIRVESPPGKLIGHVSQGCSCLRPCYHIEGTDGVPVFSIIGPICTTSCVCQDIEFDVFLYSTGAKVARITKQWSGMLRETFTDADIYGVVFPMDLSVKLKACLLAATFLIDYNYFESKGNQNTDKPGMMDTRFR